MISSALPASIPITVVRAVMAAVSPAISISAIWVIFSAVSSAAGSAAAGPRNAHAWGTIRPRFPSVLREAAFGCEKEVVIERTENCSECGGGCAKGTTAEVCPRRHGNGTTQVRRQTPMGILLPQRPAPRGSRGRLSTSPARSAGASAPNAEAVPSRQRFLPVPDNGQTISLRGQGHAGRKRRPGGRFARLPLRCGPMRFSAGRNSAFREAPISFVQAG